MTDKQKPVENVPAPVVEEKKVVTPEEFFDAIPEKEAIFVAIGGDAGLGKTHFWNTFPKPVVCDTEDRAQIVMKKFLNQYRKSTGNIKTIRDTISVMAQQLCPDASQRNNWTFVLDSASDFGQMAESEYLKEAQKEKVYPLVLWAKVYDKMDQIFEVLRKLGFNAVFTQQIKEKYVNEKATGEFEMTGYKKLKYRVDIRLQLRKGIEFNGDLYYADYVVAEVLKDCWHSIEQTKPYLIDVSYDGVFKELKSYVHLGKRDDAVKAVLSEMAAKTGIPVSEAKQAQNK
jgi:hypothetical protein